MRTLITGASGFVGRAVLRRLASEDHFEPFGAVRRDIQSPLSGVRYLRVADLGPDTAWRGAVEGMDVIIHTAAHVHVRKGDAGDALSLYRRVNVQGTVNLAKQAADAGVRRLVFLSSIKVNGEQTLPGRPFRVEDRPDPSDPYGLSKHEAEVSLAALSRDTGMEVVIIRPPLIYGPGVGANFLSLMRWVHSGVPLPFAGIQNSRSLVALDNLVELIVTCSVEAAAANRIALAADGEDVSTPQLLQRVGRALGRPVRLFSVPTRILRGLASVVGKQDISRRLLDSLQVDVSETRAVLGWSPVVRMEEALSRTAEYFLTTIRS